MHYKIFKKDLFSPERPVTRREYTAERGGRSDVHMWHQAPLIHCHRVYVYNPSTAPPGDFGIICPHCHKPQIKLPLLSPMKRRKWPS